MFNFCNPVPCLLDCAVQHFLMLLQPEHKVTALIYSAVRSLDNPRFGINMGFKMAGQGMGFCYFPGLFQGAGIYPGFVEILAMYPGALRTTSHGEIAGWIGKLFTTYNTSLFAGFSLPARSTKHPPF